MGNVSRENRYVTVMNMVSFMGHHVSGGVVSWDMCFISSCSDANRHNKVQQIVFVLAIFFCTIKWN